MVDNRVVVNSKEARAALAEHDAATSRWNLGIIHIGMPATAAKVRQAIAKAA